MKKTSILTLTSMMILLSGCAVVQPPAEPIMVDREPILVGKPIGVRLSEARNKISGQFELLNQIQQGGSIGEYKVVEHNNNLDARIGSSRTIPKAYANPVSVPVADATTKNPVGENKIKKIEWNNNSLNSLVGNFSKALGYELVIKQGSFNDVNINYAVENVTVQEALKKLQKQISPFADLIVVDDNKTVNLIYKK